MKTILMVTAFFDRREHFGGKRVNKLMPADDDCPYPACVIAHVHVFRLYWVSKEGGKKAK